MLDLIGTTVLTAVIAVNLNAAIVTMPLSATEKLTTVTIAGLWIGFVIALCGFLTLAYVGFYGFTALAATVRRDER